MNKEYVLCKTSTIVHSRWVGGQNWVKIGRHSCCMTPFAAAKPAVIQFSIILNPPGQREKYKLL